MANIPSKPSYSHGSTGTAPASPIDYSNGDPVEEQHMDYYVHTPLDKIKALIDALGTIDSDDDGIVDRADELGAGSVGTGLSGGDATSLSLDESYGATWGSQHQFNSGLDVRGDIVQDGTVIWDNSEGYIPQGRLQNDSITVAGNSVSLGGSTGIALGDLSNVGASGEGDGGGFDADAVDGYDVVKDGTDGTGVINFKTT